MTDGTPGDIVAFMVGLLRRVGVDTALAQQLEQATRQAFGGLRVRVPKHRGHASADARGQAVLDGLTAMPTGEVAHKHGISRATLYRLMKRGR